MTLALPKIKFIRPSLLTAAILLIALWGNANVEGWNWSAFDFVLIGLVLFGFGMAFELITARTPNSNDYKWAVGIALFAALLLFWINGAVGLIGSEDNPANLMYFGVLAVGFFGGILSRFKPHGMSITMFVVAASQFLVPLIAMALFRPDFEPGTFGVLVLNGFFVVAFLTSGVLFGRGGQK